MTEQRKGELFASGHLLLWCLFPVLTKILYKTLPPIASLAWISLCTAIFFFILVLVRKRFSEFTIRQAWFPMFMNALILGIVFYALYFWGLQHTSAGNASILGLFEILSSFLFFGLILRIEKYTASALVGATLLTLGTFLVLFREGLHINSGDLLILTGFSIAPLGNYYQQKARKLVSAETLLFVRIFISSIVLFILSAWTETSPSATALINQFPIIMFMGVIILGVAKLLWIESIHRIPVAKSVSINAVSPALTLAAAFFMLHEVPNWWQILGFIPMLIGAYLILNKDFLHPHTAA